MNRTFALKSAIRLEDAYFCLNCEAVMNCSDTCPVCGEKYLWPLQNWLGRVNGREFSKYTKLTPKGKWMDMEYFKRPGAA